MAHRGLSGRLKNKIIVVNEHMYVQETKVENRLELEYLCGQIWGRGQW